MKKTLLSVCFALAFLAGAAELKLGPHQVITAAWGGKMQKHPDCIELATTQKGSSYHCRMRRQIMTSIPLWGRKVIYTFSACGTGQFNAACYINTSLYNEKFVSRSKNIKLTKEWKEYSIPLFITEPDIRKIYVLLTTYGKDTTAKIKNDRLILADAPDKAISAAADFVMLPEKGSAKLTFTAPGRETLKAFDGAGEITLKGNNGKFTLETAPGTAELNTVVKGSVLGETALVGVWDEKNNMASSAYVSRVSDLQWSNFVNIAQGIQLKKPVSALFLGDSLMDYSRGFNFVDEISFWLNKNNPGKFTFRNAGIAGYTMQSMYRTIAKQPGARNLDRMKGLWDKKYDIIFIFLGHNDTVQNYGVKHEARPTQVEPSIKTWLPRLVGEIRKHSKARIVLISPASMDYDNCKKFAAKQKRPGRRYYLFGMPENLVPFCQGLKAFAGKSGLDYVDMYTPTLALPEKHRYFTAIDGVHLMPRGQHVIALELLKYLASKPL